MNAVAKAVVKNKYWIVEENGNKVATIQAIDEGGYAYVYNNQRERFPTIKLLSKKYNIIFDNTKTARAEIKHDCYGYPCQGRPYNQVWDVQRRLPVYSKSPKSRSFFCAGYYVIRFNNAWICEFSPKIITIGRYEHFGPFQTEAEQLAKRAELT